jgi:hypothetical protein
MWAQFLPPLTRTEPKAGCAVVSASWGSWKGPCEGCSPLGGARAVSLSVHCSAMQPLDGRGGGRGMVVVANAATAMGEPSSLNHAALPLSQGGAMRSMAPSKAFRRLRWAARIEVCLE